MTNSGWPEALPRVGNRKLKRLESIAPWFEVYAVNSHTFALLEPHHFEEVISHLILGDERAVLFDTGLGIGDMQAEIARLTDLPIIVINSHYHFDHVGDNHRFAEVWAYDNDATVARIEGGRTIAECEPFLRPGTYRHLPPDFDPATYAIRPSLVTRRLGHGDVIELGERALTVHHTPGHSPDSICLLDSRDRLLFTGDTFYPGMLYGHFDDSDFEVYLQSMKYLAGLLDAVSHLCPAHNEAQVSIEVLARACDAFEQIAAGRLTFALEDGIRIYCLEGFGVMLPQNMR